VKIYRLEPYGGGGKFGHYWIEVGKEGFGWYPKKETGIVGWLTGVEGKFYDGNDPKTGERWEVDVYDVYVSSSAESALQTSDYIKSTIREVARTYTEYGNGSDCHAFQYDVINKLDWIVKARGN